MEERRKDYQYKGKATTDEALTDEALTDEALKC